MEKFQEKIEEVVQGNIISLFTAITFGIADFKNNVL